MTNVTTRRSFFRSLARAAAIIALAPQIAFRAPKIAITAQPFESLNLDALIARAYQIEPTESIDIFTDRTTADKMRLLMGKYYEEKYGEVLS